MRSGETQHHTAPVGGNSQTGNSRVRESMGIPRKFPFRKWRFLGIPRNSHGGGILALQGGFYLQGGIVLFTGRCLFIAPLKKSLLAASKPEENGPGTGAKSGHLGPV